MAQQFIRGVTVLPVGQQAFEIDGLPNNSEGFELVLGVGASWAATSPGSLLLSLDGEIALDGANFAPWFHFETNGGQPISPLGQPLTEWRVMGTWPGENDGSGGRRKLRGTNLRVTVTVGQAFQVESVLLRTF